MRDPNLIFDDALNAFLKKDCALLLSDVSERSICGRLAVFLEFQFLKEEISGYYADPEYNRMHHGYVKTIIDDEHRVFQITSDLIVHTRGEKPPPHDNLIAVEAKKSARPEQEKQTDRARLRAMTQPIEQVSDWGGHPKHVCGYAVGIFMEIDAKKRRISLEYFRKGVANEKMDRFF